MARYRDELPQLSGDLFLTDGGLETTLVFHEGIDLPEFAAFVLLENDEGRDVRQVAILDSKGRVAVHTGKKCIPDAGHHVAPGLAVQANLMANDTVWDAMARAYEKTEGPLAERMVAALAAAQEAGGEPRRPATRGRTA